MSESLQTEAPPDNRCRWEYIWVNSDYGDNYDTFRDKLNAWGYQGFEVITLNEIEKSKHPLGMPGHYIEWKAWLKRKYHYDGNYIAYE